MRVLHVVNTLSAGGAELHLLDLCRHLKVIDVDPVVAFLREHVTGSRSLRADFAAAGVDTVDLHAPSRWDPRFLTWLPALVRRVRPAVVHTHLPRADIGVSALRSALPAPVVTSVHGIYADRWFGRIATPFMRWAYSRARAVIAISGCVKRWLTGSVGVSPEKVSVVHYGIDAERFGAPLATDVRAAWKLGPGPLIGSVGRLEPGKGFACLIRAMAAVRSRFPSARLVITGHDPGGYRGELESLALRLGVGESVRIAGFCHDVPSLLGALDVFAFASRSEGFGRVVVEAMAAGRPVVVSGVPPLTEIVEDGTTGLHADPDEPDSFARAIVSLLERPDRADRLARNARARVSADFTNERMAAETLAVYESLAEF